MNKRQSLMFENIDIRHLKHAKKSHRSIIEKALEMRCESFLSHVKSKLLIKTIVSVNDSRQSIRKNNLSLEEQIEQKKKDLSLTQKDLKRELHAHAEIEQHCHKLAQALESTGAGIIITDTSSRIQYANKAFCDMLGYSADEVLGHTPDMFNSGEQSPEFYQKLWQTIQSGKVWHETIIDKTHDGCLIPIIMTISPIFDYKHHICSYVATLQDISKEKKLEEEFQQAQKMDALGTLVGGIAHDFNNMLAAIIGNTYLAKAGTPPQAKDVHEHLDHIDQMSFRAGDMVKQLLAFARKGRIKKVTLSLKALMKESFKLQSVAVPANIQFDAFWCELPLNIHADATQLQQVFINLINNARDAVDGVLNPHIHVDLDVFQADEAFLSKHPQVKQTYLAHLSVTDNGSGMSAPTLEKIFDPFFTTKEVGKGTGLGLAMVFGMMDSHGGTIAVESQWDIRTKFHLYFPLIEEDCLVLQSNHAGVQQGSGETILVVDDNETLRYSTQKLLQSLGYQVLLAEHGQEAVDIYNTQSELIDLTILDVVMPVLGGYEAAQMISQAFPDAKILLSTGYDRHVMLTQKNMASYQVLEKPFSVAILSQAIGQILSGTADA